jgi:hypothetical protein
MELPRGGSFYGGKLVWCIRQCSDLSLPLPLLMMPMLSVCVHAAAALHLYQILPLLCICTKFLIDFMLRKKTCRLRYVFS